MVNFLHKSIRSCEREGIRAVLFLVLAAITAFTFSSCDNKIEEEEEKYEEKYEEEYKSAYVSNEIRDEISSYFRDSYLQWSQQASPSDVLAVNNYNSSLYHDFFRRSWYTYLVDKFNNNKELVLQLFDGLYELYNNSSDAFFCREFLQYCNTYKFSFSYSSSSLTIMISIEYPLIVENVFKIVQEKYANTNSSSIPEDFNNTLQSALMQEGKSGLPLGVIYGTCRLSLRFNTITGEPDGIGFISNHVNGNHRLNGGAYGLYYNFWDKLWDSINFEKNGTYADQIIDLQSFNGYYLKLHLTGYNPYKYKVVFYILVDGVWWIKPYFDFFNSAGFNTQYTINTNTGGKDSSAWYAAAMILPIDADVNINNFTSSSAKAIAIEYIENSSLFYRPPPLA